MCTRKHVLDLADVGVCVCVCLCVCVYIYNIYVYHVSGEFLAINHVNIYLVNNWNLGIYACVTA